MSMPFTPFHFGPGAALHALLPRRLSFLAFCAANVLTDVEPLYYMLTRQHPVHRFLHTCIGAGVTTVAIVLAFLLARRAAARFHLPDLFAWHALEPPQVLLGAATGAGTHVLLDSVMHADVRPFAPFSAANPLLHAVSVPQLHGLCIALGAVGVAILAIRCLSFGAR